MDPKSLASEITRAGADKVLEQNPKRIDDAVVNTVIKQGANALESGSSKGTVAPAVGAGTQPSRSNCSCMFATAISTLQYALIRRTHTFAGGLLCSEL